MVGARLRTGLPILRRQSDVCVAPGGDATLRRAEHRAESINSKLAQMAERLQRASEEMRRPANSQYAGPEGLPGAAGVGVASPEPGRRPTDHRPGRLAPDGR